MAAAPLVHRTRLGRCTQCRRDVLVAAVGLFSAPEIAQAGWVCEGATPRHAARPNRAHVRAIVLGGRCHDIGREHGAGKPLLKTVLEVRASPPHLHRPS